MSDIRLRFAPSPTGMVHVGSLRTAFYNFLFARKHGGRLILRIEDTDQTRYVPGAVDNLLAAMNWAGVEFDEGPTQGGDAGPYYQSQRLPIYQDRIQILLKKGSAYHCFCDATTLEKMRADQEKAGQPQRYDGRCRKLSPAEVLKKLQSGDPHVLRLRVEPGEAVRVQDIIRGEVTFERETIDEQVLIKSDGFPTYHFANVVDDHEMRISHVIRGEEWLPSTPKHVLLYQAFGWKEPLFAHLPLLLNPDRSKLSKRQGDVAVEDYRAKGFLPEAFLNFVALLGWHTPDDREIFSVPELVELFSLERVSKSGAIFDVQKLQWINAQYLKKMDKKELATRLSKELAATGFFKNHPRFPFQDVSFEGATPFHDWEKLPAEEWDYLSALLEYALASAVILKEIPVILNNFLVRPQPNEVLRALSTDPVSSKVLSAFATLLKNETQSPGRDRLKELIQAVGKETGARGKALYHTLRQGLTWREEGFDLATSLFLLGKQEMLDRLATLGVNA